MRLKPFLMQYGAVREAVVMAVDSGDEKALCAYVTLEGADGEETVGGTRNCGTIFKTVCPVT